MARSEISTEFNTFVGGILTEANPINYPPGYSLDEENFILERNGTRRRRSGTVLDTGATDFTARAATEFASFATITYRDYFVWRDATFNEKRQDVLVLIYDLEQVTSLDASLGLLMYSIEDSTTISDNFLDSYTRSDIHLMSISEHSSGLAVSYRTTDPVTADIVTVIITRDDDAGAFTERFSNLQIRDFQGVFSEDVTERPASLSDNHAYNLYNNGWLQADVNAWYAADTTYPSLADSSAFSKDFGTAFNPTYMDNTLFGTSRAPLGKAIITPWYPISEYRDFAFDVSGVIVTTTPDYSALLTKDQQSVVKQVFLGGRLFYLCNAGRLLSNGSTMLLYSQNGSDAAAFGNCYQVNDPTAEAFNSPLDTDGGLLDVSSVGEGVDLETSRSRMMIFGTKGVFEVFSSDDVFKPTNIGVRKVSNNILHYDKELITITGTSPVKDYYRSTSNSVITVEDNFYYWSDAGVIALVFDTRNNQFFEENITASTIDTLYREIPIVCKAYAKGVYLSDDNTMIWAYSEDTTNPEKYSKLLCYDMILKAWYKMNIATSADASITGVFQVPLDATLTGRADHYKRLTFLADTTDLGFRTGYPTDSTFEDFSGSTYSAESQAFLQTGYLNANDSAKQKQATYIVPSFLRTEDGFTDDGDGNLTPTNESSCVISAYWDYADDDVSGKINDSFEAYRYNRLYVPEDASDTFNYGQSVLTTKNRLTGRGRALSLRFETSEGKDCRLLGWNLGFGANGKV